MKLPDVNKLDDNVSSRYGNKKKTTPSVLSSVNLTTKKSNRLSSGKSFTRSGSKKNFVPEPTEEEIKIQKLQALDNLKDTILIVFKKFVSQ